MKRSLSFALLVLHMLVVTVGGALATESAAVAAGPRVVLVASPSATPCAASAAAAAPTSASTHRAAVDQGTRGHGNAGAGHGAPVDLFLGAAGITVLPAPFVGLRDWRTDAPIHRSLHCVANAARGPPSPLL